MANFADINVIFNKAMAASQAKIGHVDLQAKYQEPTFPNFYGDFTNAQLKAGMARTLRLIQPELIPAPGTVGDKGDQANLVLALKGNLQLQGTQIRQMPGGGPPCLPRISPQLWTG